MSKKPVQHYNPSIHGKRMSTATKIAVMAMKDSGLTATEAARRADVHVSTIVRAWENPELQELSPSVVQKTKTGLSGLFYKRGLEATLGITAEKIAKSTALQLATVAGIMTEKGRLMEGLSTENVSFRGLNQSLDADRQKLMERLNALDGK